MPFNRGSELDKQITDQGLRAWTIEWVVPEDLPFFEGHFPKNPILPSIILLEGSVELVQLFFDGEFDQIFLRGVKKAKFFSPIGPGTKVQIQGRVKGPEKELEKGLGDHWVVEWFDESGGKKLASFSLQFEFPI